MTLLFEISTITFDTFLLVAFFKKFEMDRCYILYYSCLALDQSKNLRLGNMIFLSHNILTLSTLLITDCSCFKWGYCVLFIVFVSSRSFSWHLDTWQLLQQHDWQSLQRRFCLTKSTVHQNPFFDFLILQLQFFFCWYLDLPGYA